MTVLRAQVSGAIQGQHVHPYIDWKEVYLGGGASDWQVSYIFCESYFIKIDML